MERGWVALSLTRQPCEGEARHLHLSPLPLGENFGRCLRGLAGHGQDLLRESRKTIPGRCALFETVARKADRIDLFRASLPSRASKRPGIQRRSKIAFTFPLEAPRPWLYGADLVSL